MDTYIIFRKELFIKAMLYIVVCSIVGMASIYLIKSKILSIISVCMIVLPIPFFKLLLKKFTKKTVINLFDDSFVITIINSDGNEIQKEFILKEINSYSIQFPNDNYRSIKFNLRSGKTFEYSFFQKPRNEKETPAEKIIDSYNLLIKDYNKVNNANQIQFKPSFYATSSGLLCIIGLSALFILATIVVMFKNEKVVPVTLFFGFILIIQLIMKRRKELIYYKSVKQL